MVEEAQMHRAQSEGVRIEVEARLQQVSVEEARESLEKPHAMLQGNKEVEHGPGTDYGTLW